MRTKQTIEYIASDTVEPRVSGADSATDHVRPQYGRAVLSQPRRSVEQEGRREAGATDRAHSAQVVSHVQLVHLLASHRSTALHRSTLLQSARRQVLLPLSNYTIVFE